MAISSSTSSTNSTSLDQQLATLQKELTTEEQSKDDAKTKLSKEQAINAQIQTVDDEISASKQSGSTATQTESENGAKSGLSIRV